MFDRRVDPCLVDSEAVEPSSMNHRASSNVTKELDSLSRFEFLVGRLSLQAFTTLLIEGCLVVYSRNTK